MLPCLWRFRQIYIVSSCWWWNFENDSPWSKRAERNPLSKCRLWPMSGVSWRELFSIKLLIWLQALQGRIAILSCSSKFIPFTFRADLEAL